MPYSYYDGVRKLRLVAPEYGDDGKMLAPSGAGATPVLSMVGEPSKASPVDMVFYNANQFPARGAVGFSSAAMVASALQGPAAMKAMTSSICR